MSINFERRRFLQDCGLGVGWLAAQHLMGATLPADPLAPKKPPMPAKVKAEQAAKFAQSLVRGEPNRSKIAWENIVEDRVRELV